MKRATLAALADHLEASARLARALVDEGPTDPDALLSLADAAAEAKTSIGVVKAGIRKGVLAAFGGQRDRSVRRADLDQWIAERRTRPADGPDDADVARRMKRLGRTQARRRAS